MISQAILDYAVLNDSGPSGTNDLLDQLRAAVGPPGVNPKVDGLLEQLRQSTQRLAIEHSGMAEELLCVYEQLGVVFDVSRRLGTVQNEADVFELFVDSLRRSFDRRGVFALRPRPDGTWNVHGGDLTVTQWLEARIVQACESGTTIVETSALSKGPAPDSAPQLAIEVMVAPVFAGDVFVCAIVLTRGEDVTPFQSSDMLVLESLSTFCGDLLRNHRLLHELREMSVTMVRSLVSAVDQKDEYTSGHSLRVGYFATELGKQLKLKDVDLQMLQWSALLHDVGKIGIRDDVLKKEGKLTDEEFRHIQEHPVRSHKVVEQVPQLSDALAGVLYHHEHYNGAGYPSGLKGEEIPLQARIIQIADVFDALTSTRSYRSAFNWRRALSILEEEAGETVDPHLQKIFDKMMREILETDPSAWEDLLRKANEFAKMGEENQCDSGG